MRKSHDEPKLTTSRFSTSREGQYEYIHIDIYRRCTMSFTQTLNTIMVRLIKLKYAINFNLTTLDVTYTHIYIYIYIYIYTYCQRSHAVTASTVTTIISHHLHQIRLTWLLITCTCRSPNKSPLRACCTQSMIIRSTVNCAWLPCFTYLCILAFRSPDDSPAKLQHCSLMFLDTRRCSLTFLDTRSPTNLQRHRLSAFS